MYLHVGEDVMVRTDEIIAILDKETVNDSVSIKEFLQSNDLDTVNLSKGAFKSLVITDQRIFLSPLASNTLNKRSNLRNQYDSLI